MQLVLLYRSLASEIVAQASSALFESSSNNT
jgi:hypothetical protein